MAVTSMQVRSDYRMAITAGSNQGSKTARRARAAGPSSLNPRRAGTPGGLRRSRHASALRAWCAPAAVCAGVPRRGGRQPAVYLAIGIDSDDSWEQPSGETTACWCAVAGLRIGVLHVDGNAAERRHRPSCLQEADGRSRPRRGLDATGTEDVFRQPDVGVGRGSGGDRAAGWSHQLADDGDRVPTGVATCHRYGRRDDGQILSAT
jgi:hypothetical protein